MDWRVGGDLRLVSDYDKSLIDISFDENLLDLNGNYYVF